MDWLKIRKQISEAILEEYGEREAENIAAYYVDAIRFKDWSEANLKDDLSQLIAGIPVQYVTRTSFFYGYQFYVDKSVLIPRPETEELVHWIISENRHRIGGWDIMDIGVGSGCILLSVLARLRTANGIGLDISSLALNVFRNNAELLELDVMELEFDILSAETSALPKVDVIVSNPPYIKRSETPRMSISTLEHEPDIALFVNGKDPLVFYKKVIELAYNHLNKDGLLYFETSDLYHDDLQSYVEEKGIEYEFKKDLQGNWRMLKLQF